MSMDTITLTPISGAALGGLKRTAKYKALIDLGLKPDRALFHLGYQAVTATPAAATAPAKATTPVQTLVQTEQAKQAKPVDPRVQALIDAGWKPKKARKLIAEQDAAAQASVTLDKPAKAKPAKVKAQPASATVTAEPAKHAASAERPATKSASQVQAEQLVEGSGLTYMSGRVTGDYRRLAEALVRVGNSKTGHPEIVRFDDGRRIAGVIVYKDAYGRVVQQQLTTPKEV